MVWFLFVGGRYRTRTYDLPHVKRMLDKSAYTKSSEKHGKHVYITYLLYHKVKSKSSEICKNSDKIDLLLT